MCVVLANYNVDAFTFLSLHTPQSLAGRYSGIKSAEYINTSSFKQINK